MTSIDAIQRRIDRLINQIDLQNRPRLIDCTGAKEEMLAMLEQHLTSEDPEPEDDSATHAAWLEQCEALDALLEQSVSDIEARYNVKIVGG